VTPFAWIAAILEMLGGSRRLPDALTRRLDVAVLRGLWWLLLFVLVLAFAGHNSKFVYVDF
jgi:hypothetical protein